MNSKSSNTITIQGTVQGVGFRPFVYRTAIEYSITGSVSNNSGGVIIHAFGNANSMAGFIQSIKTNAPVLARDNEY